MEEDKISIAEKALKDGHTIHVIDHPDLKGLEGLTALAKDGHTVHVVDHPNFTNQLLQGIQEMAALAKADVSMVYSYETKSKKHKGHQRPYKFHK